MESVTTIDMFLAVCSLSELQLDKKAMVVTKNKKRAFDRYFIIMGLGCRVSVVRYSDQTDVPVDRRCYLLH